MTITPDYDIIQTDSKFGCTKMKGNEGIYEYRKKTWYYKWKKYERGTGDIIVLGTFTMRTSTTYITILYIYMHIHANSYFISHW